MRSEAPEIERPLAENVITMLNSQNIMILVASGLRAALDLCDPLRVIEPP